MRKLLISNLFRTVFQPKNMVALVTTIGLISATTISLKKTKKIIEALPTIVAACEDVPLDCDAILELDPVDRYTLSLLGVKDAGFFIPVEIGDTVWVDNNGNGLQDLGEPPLEGVTVSLYQLDMMGVGQFVATVFTDADGRYKFDALPPGDYYTVFDVSTATHPDAASMVETFQNVNGGTLDPNDSDIDEFGNSDTTTVASGGMDCTLDAGYFVPVSVGDTVFVDANGNGIQDAGEGGIAGVGVSLFLITGAGPDVQITTDYDGNLLQLTTDPQGRYKFENLPPGEYYVIFDVSLNPANYAPTLENVGADVSIDSDINQSEVSDTTILGSGQMDCTLDAGYYIPVMVGDTAWVDYDGDGIQDPTESGLPNVTVSLFTAAGQPAVDAQGNPVMTDVTDLMGYYKFNNLPPGDYYVVFDQSTTTGPDAGQYVPTIQNVSGNGMDAVDSDIDYTTEQSDDTGLIVSGDMDCSVDAGYYVPVSIGDTVFVDVNGNGVQDGGDTGLEDVTVALFNNDGSPAVDSEGNAVPTTTTNSMGYYKFNNLPPGSYYVAFDLSLVPNAADYVRTYENIITGTVATDSDVDAMMHSDTTAFLGSSEMDCRLDAGYALPVDVCGLAWIDANLDGLQQLASEPGLPGIEVQLYLIDPVTGIGTRILMDAYGMPLPDPLFTDMAGEYTFVDVFPGQYYVIFNSGGIPPTTQDVGMDDDIDSDIDLLETTDTLLVPSNTMDCSFDAGYEGLDFGDLPDSYVTTDASSGFTAPKHVMRDGKYLGNQIDQDADGVPSADGLGDDSNPSAYILPPGAMGPDDEDGIEFLTPLLPGNEATIKITYTVPDGVPVDDAFIDAWIDFDANGMFNPGDELMFVAVDGSPIAPTSHLGLAGGTDVMILATFVVPVGAEFPSGNAYARFRMSCSSAPLSPDSGLSLDGEIEDYVVPLAKVGNLVWLDENYNGLQDDIGMPDEEPGIENVTVVLDYEFIDPARNISISLADTAVTAVDGSYYFCGLLPTDIGKYTLKVITPLGLISTLNNIGMDEEIDSDNDIIYNFGKDSVETPQFMIMPPLALPTSEAGIGDVPNIVSDFPDNQVDQTYDFGFLPLDFGDLPEMDYGDLPNSYNTDPSGALHPPMHIVTENKRIGLCIDSEVSSQPDPMGLGDDMGMGDPTSDFEFGDCSNPSDEDGIEFLTPVMPGDTGFIKLIYTLQPAVTDTAGYINGWIDYDDTGNFGPGDAIEFFSIDGVDLPANTTNLALEAGNDACVILGFVVPPGAIFHDGSIYSRFRLSCEGDLGPLGVLPSGFPPEGEIEDHVVQTAKVGNLVWWDQNYDGIQTDVGGPNEEPGLENVEVILTYTIQQQPNIDLVVEDTLVTDVNGIYNFCGLVASDVGEYKITVLAPNGLTPTYPDVVTTTDSLDSDHFTNMGDTIVMTDLFMITPPIDEPIGEDGIGDAPNDIGTYVDSLINQTFDFGFVPLDYGDHLDGYTTLNSSGGPVHLITEGLFLGNCVDAEIDAQIDTDAGDIDDGDDNNVSGFGIPLNKVITDDEDGILFTSPLVPGTKATLEVTYTSENADAFLNAWIDYNGNGVFDPMEAIDFYTQSVAATTDGPLPQGTDQTIEFCFDVPLSALYNDGDVYARFRISPTGGLMPTGGFTGGVPGAVPGEVEDVFMPLAKIGNLAWFDKDLEGDQDGVGVVPPEDGVAGLDLVLTWAGINSTIFGDGDDIEYPITTAGDGTYYVCGLIPGKYMLLPNKYAAGAVTPEDTVPVRYILTIPDNTDQGMADDLDSDFLPGAMVMIPDLLLNDLVNGADGNPQDENGYLDNPGSNGTFPDVQDDLMFDMGFIPEPNIEAILGIPGVGVPSTGTCGNFNVIVDVCIKNTGYVDDNGTLVGAPLESLGAELDMDSLFGAAYVGVSVAPVIVTDLGYETTDTCDLPAPARLPSGNAGYDGINDINLIASDGLLYPDEAICVRVVVEVRPSELPLAQAMLLNFHAKGLGSAVNYLGQPIPDYFNGGAQYVACDSSDTNFEFVGGFMDPDEPTLLGDCWTSTTELAQNLQVNISGDENCEAMITPATVLTNHMPECDKDQYPLGGFYVIDIQDPDGNYIVENVSMALIDVNEYLNQNLKISVSSVVEDCNSIWGYGLIEDKFAPQIMCRNDTITCLDMVQFPEPTVIENCGDYELIMLNEIIRDVSCIDDEISRMLIRTYKAIDAAGNESPECDDTLYIRKFDIGTIDMPVFEQNITCTSGFPMDENGNPDPSVYGTPTLGGVPLWPDQLIMCNTVVHYEDATILDTECAIKIMRTWTVTSWYCGQDDTRIFNQLFNIKDEQDPIITCPPDFTINSDPTLECAGTTELPKPIVIFECSDWSYDVVYRISDGANNPAGPILTEGISYNANTDTYTITGLPVGQNWVIYTVTDICGNETDCFIEVTVTDEKDPVAICEHFTTVSVPVDGSAQVYANSFDDGSFDDCAIDGFSVARLTEGDDLVENPVYGDYVEFFCSDVGIDQMVGLRVWDAAGNTNECMVIVEVQDKILPNLIPLPDITVSCTYDFDPENLSVFGVIVQTEDDRTEILLPPGTEFTTGSSGYDGLVTDNCEMTIVEEIGAIDINNCGLGYVIRDFTLTDPQGFVITASQRIDIVNFDPFNEDHITWPLDYDALNICDGEELLPEMLPPGYDVPVFSEDECALVGLTYEDERFEIAESGACFKIIRHWKFIDWCQLADPEFEFFTYDQIIKVSNNIEPEIVTATGIDSVVCTFDPFCEEGGFIDLIAEGTDDCTIEEDLFWTYMLDLGDDGLDIIEGVGGDASGTYDVGVHRIIWRLEDKCGNIADETLEYTFEIRNCKAPTAYCISGLSTELEGMDTNGDQEIDDEMSIMTPDMFDAGSSHICGYEVFLSFSSDVNDTELVFDCDDLGQQPVELWVTDINGNQSYCLTYVIVEDNNDVDICDGMNANATVSGRIYTEEELNIQDTEVALEGSELGNQMTTEAGEYGFSNMPMGGDYEVIPARDIDPMNGVSTLDLVLIQKHILGLDPLDSPYQMIAADINRSGSISASDLLVLRKMILGIYTDFPDNTSWRFVDEGYSFPDDTNPWAEVFPETYNIYDLSNDMIIDFIGIKTGDVNGSVEPTGLQNVTVRNVESLILTMESIDMIEDQSYELKVRSDEFKSILGLQFTLQFNTDMIEVLEINGAVLEVSEANTGLQSLEDGLITFSYNEGEAMHSLIDEDLMVIKVKAKQSSKLSIGGDIMINSKLTKAEAYRSTGTIIQLEEIELVERAPDALAGIMLYQNEPNPWMRSTKIGFDMVENAKVIFRIMDVSGKLLRVISNDYKAGYNEIELRYEDIPAKGILYYEMETGDQKIIKKMIKIE